MRAQLLVLCGLSIASWGCRWSRPSIEDARRFLDQVEARLWELTTEESHAAWVQATYISYDTEILAAKAQQRRIQATVEFAKQTRKFDGLKLPDDLARKMKLLRLALTLPAPSDPAKAAELTRLATRLESTYGAGKYCPQPGQCLDLEQMTRIMATSRDPKQLLEIWRGWRTIAPPMRPMYRRLVELSNEGARELGFNDTGELWRSKYDMPPDQFAREMERLWEQVRPLYVSLHAYVRKRLRQHYGELVPERGPIPAHLLGNMWAQSWENIYPLVAPPKAKSGVDLTQLLRKKGLGPVEMVRYGERFFTSLGFEPLPETFWQRSLFRKPQDRDVVCHASAWCIDSLNDLRIKMCIDVTGEDFITIHHELGHNFYQRAYNKQPFLFRDSANDGFHEALGDTIALSVTPEYLVKIGLLDRAPDPSDDLGLLLQRALDKVAFLPFGLLIDQWRWKVFSGEIPPERYNQAWWELVQKYQGVAPAVPRSEQDFDPGAKYHIPANVPYARYFLAHILQFQFHRALARAAGCTGPLHRCSIYGSKEAGARLKAMMEMGQSRPWPEALEVLTGQRQMDATALLEYFEPLRAWLNEQIKDVPVGW